jgi:hypothetical protein
MTSRLPRVVFANALVDQASLPLKQAPATIREAAGVTRALADPP